MPVQRPDQIYTLKMDCRPVNHPGLELHIPTGIDRDGFYNTPVYDIEYTINREGMKTNSGVLGYITSAGRTNCCGAQTIYLCNTDYRDHYIKEDWRPYATLSLLKALQVNPKGVNIIITPGEYKFNLSKEAQGLLEKYFKVELVPAGRGVSILNLIPLDENSIYNFRQEEL